MKMLVLFVAVTLCACGAFAAPIGAYQQGTIVRMHMGDCALTHHSGFMTNFGPPQAAMVEESCPEYTLVTDKVVFVIVGKTSNQLVPLAEVIDFRMEKREMAVRIDDARKESRFDIKEMTLRTEWDMVQRHVERQLNDASPNDSGREPVDASLRTRNRE